MIRLRRMTADDLPRFRGWLAAPHVARWYHDPEDWIAEVERQDGEFRWISHFIALEGNRPVGFCQYYALRDSGEDWLSADERCGAYSIDYLIGEADMLRRGCGRQIVACLTAEISRHPDARCIAVCPERENEASRALLRACGFLLSDEARGVFLLPLPERT